MGLRRQAATTEAAPPPQVPCLQPTEAPEMSAPSLQSWSQGVEDFMECCCWTAGRPAIAQLVEHLTVELCSYQLVPGSIPGGQICIDLSFVCSVGSNIFIVPSQVRTFGKQIPKKV